MRPWTVDADDIQLSEDFDPAVLHHTPGVDDFLDPRGNKFFVLGTKGLGKTLLLKARRISAGDGVVCLPRNALIDKPIGDKIFSAEMIALYGESTENWKKLWRMAIVAATLKAVDRAGDSKVSPPMAGILADGELAGVMDHFVYLLDLSRTELLRSSRDVDRFLIPRIRNLDTPVAIFIDSIDEYFNKHILTLSPADAGELSPNIWHLSQMGLIEAAYELRRLTHHLKVFAAVRKEAFDRFGGATSMVQQYRGSTVEIHYTNESLREILVSNVLQERKRNLTDPSQLKREPLGAFAGLTHVMHVYTGEHEELGDYVLRHTLGRPRDLMTIGGAVARIPPSQRNEATVKGAVNEAATEIAEEYLNEIAPFTSDLDLEAAFAVLPRNIFSADDAEAFSRRYNRRAHGKASAHWGLLTTLYCAGLFGIVVDDHVAGEKVQRFQRPGAQSASELSRPPASAHYLVHPILSELIARVNPGYLGGVDRTNIVGDGRPWIEEPTEATYCVMKADIRRFSEIMHGEHEVEVLTMLHDVVQTHAVGCPIAEVNEGDSIMIVHENPRTILKVARRIMEDLHEAPGNPQLRVAIDCGPLDLAAGQAGLPRGTPFRVAARLEPHVEPGQIWVTEEFRHALEEAPGFYEAVPVASDRWASGEAATVNLKKAGSDEPDEAIAVYRVVERG